MQCIQSHKEVQANHIVQIISKPSSCVARKSFFFFPSFLFLCLVVFFFASSFSFASNTTVMFGGNEHLAQKWTYLPHVDVGGYYLRNKPHHAVQADLFFPLWQRYDHLLFSDVRFFDLHPDTNDSGGSLTGVNVYLGSRWMLSERDFFGIYGSIDRIKTEEENSFNQFTLGEEYWHNRWFIGGNLYFPFGPKKQEDRKADLVRELSAGIAGHENYKTLWYGKGYERSIPGVDLTVGYEILSKDFSRLTLYAGGYCYGDYIKPREVPTIWGPRGRMTYEWIAKPGGRLLGALDRITLEGEIQKDKARGVNWNVGLKLTIGPLTSNNSILKGVRKHMVDPVRSDTLVTRENLHEELQMLKKSDVGLSSEEALVVAEVTTESQFSSALADPVVDVIDVDGAITDFTEQTIARPVVITGGEYDFVAGGHQFIVGLGGQHGELHAASGENLLYVSLNEQGEVVLRDLTLRVLDGTTQRVIHNDPTKSMGHLIVRGLDSNGVVRIEVGDARTGAFSFSGNTFNSSNGEWVVRMIASGTGNLTLNAFDSNVIDAHFASPWNPWMDDGQGVRMEAESGGKIIVNGAIANNTISSGLWCFYMYTAANGEITMNAPMQNNSFIGNGFTLSSRGVISFTEPFRLNNSVFVESIVYDNGTIRFNNGFYDNDGSIHLSLYGSASAFEYIKIGRGVAGGTAGLANENSGSTVNVGGSGGTLTIEP